MLAGLKWNTLVRESFNSRTPSQALAEESPMRSVLKVLTILFVLPLGLVACDPPSADVPNNMAGTPDGGPDEPGVENLGNDGSTSALGNADGSSGS
jgi:hypothetical protein